MVAFSHQSVWMFHVTRFHRGLAFHTFDRHCKATPHSVKPICLSCNLDPKTFLTKRIIKITWWQLYHGVGVWGIEGRRRPDQLPGLTLFFSKTHQNSNHYCHTRMARMVIHILAQLCQKPTEVSSQASASTLFPPRSHEGNVSHSRIRPFEWSRSSLGQGPSGHASSSSFVTNLCIMFLLRVCKWSCVQTSKLQPIKEVFDNIGDDDGFEEGEDVIWWWHGWGSSGWNKYNATQGHLLPPPIY